MTAFNRESKRGSRLSNRDHSRFDCKILIVERNAFLRDCLSRSATHCAVEPGAVEPASFASLGQLIDYRPTDGSTVVLLSILSLTEEEADEEFASIAKLDPQLRTMILAPADDLNKALAALSQGANGYISMNAGLEMVIQALRFVSAGGTYVPAQCLLAAAAPALCAQNAADAITSRELGVIQAIRQGKPNKLIAYELNMCESTVKVHVRNIMKKLQAKNRTDIAIKSANMKVSKVLKFGPESNLR